MSPHRVRARRDAPALALAWAVALLPSARRDWAEAMQAELASIENLTSRWRFVRGCALAVARRPAFGAIASWAIPIGIVLATVLLTVRTPYLPMHIGLIAMVAVLGTLYLTAGGSALLALPATGLRLAAAVRAGGALALAGLALGIVLGFRGSDGNVADRAHTGLPIFTFVLAVYLVGFLSLTAAEVVETWVLVRGVALGVGAALVWLVVVIAQPPLPLSGGWAFAFLTAAVFAAAAVGAPRGVAVPAALGTALVGALSLFVFARLALAYGPAAWVPSDSAALTPAARLAQSRGEAADTYLGILLFGVLAALANVANVLASRRSRPTRLRRERSANRGRPATRPAGPPSAGYPSGRAEGRATRPGTAG